MDLRSGDIGFGPIKGAAGMLVNAGQLLLGEGFHVGTLDIRHVFVVTKTDHTYPNSFIPRVVEAMPSGARQVAIAGPAGTGDRWTPEYAYVRLREDYPGQADDAAAIARAMIGTPYSFASYAALAAWRFGLSTPRLEKWINRRGAMVSLPASRPMTAGGRLPREAICSVLADQAWSLTGKKIFDDGRPHQCVTPGALAMRLLEHPDAKWTFPKSAR
jgi:hypothetical protein